jgi:hypothetical protein
MTYRHAAALAAAALLLGACGTGGEPDDGAMPTPMPSATASSTETATPTPEPTSPAPMTTAPVACAPFGSLDDQQSSDPLTMSTMTGKEVRVGRHDCYERWVFEMRGTGGVPGWTVGYRDPLIADPAGFAVDLLGEASLEVVVRVWTVTDYEGRPPEWPPFQSATTILTQGFEALLESRSISAFEGTTQFGLGIDTQRPFRAFWLNGPPRLVVDIYTGEAL